MIVANIPRKKLICPAVILLAAVIFIVPMLISGPPSGVDLIQHFQFASSIEHSILTGDLFPHWASMENSGYGGIGLRFYPPLAYYVLAAAKILTGDWYFASFLAFLFWGAVSGFGVYFWAKEWFSDQAATLAAVLYIFAPYHTLQLYSAFIYADYAASAILPFCFLFVTKVCRRGSLADVFGLSLSIAALIFTHLPSTVIGGLALGFYTLLSLRFRIFSKESGKLIGGVILGLAASSFQWIKVITEIGWLSHSADKYSHSGLYDYSQNFLLSFPYLAGLDADNRGLWFADLTLLVTLICTVPFIIVFFLHAETGLRRKLTSVLLLGIFSIFMASILSRPIWDQLPILQKVQFPWRGFSIISMSLVIFTAAGFHDYLGFLKSKEHRPYYLLITGCLLMSLTFSYAQIMRQSVYLSWPKFTELSKQFSGAENCECWLPIWANKNTATIPDKIVAENRTTRILDWGETEMMFSAEPGPAGRARLAIHYYPYWQATVNGAPAALFYSDDGALSIDLPSEPATVKLAFVEPVFVRVSSYATIFLLSSLCFSLVILFVRGRRLEMPRAGCKHRALAIS